MYIYIYIYRERERERESSIIYIYIYVYIIHIIKNIYIYVCICICIYICIKVFIKAFTWLSLDCHNYSSYYSPYIFLYWMKALNKHKKISDKNMCFPLINNHNFQIIFLLSLTITCIFCICFLKTIYQHFLYYLWIYCWK